MIDWVGWIYIHEHIPLLIHFICRPHILSRMASSVLQEEEQSGGGEREGRSETNSLSQTNTVEMSSWVKETLGVSRCVCVCLFVCGRQYVCLCEREDECVQTCYRLVKHSTG